MTSVVRAVPKPKRKAKRWSRVSTSAADAAWALHVKECDDWTCQRCLRKYPRGGRAIQAAHIWSRRHRATRHDDENGFAACTGCHRFFHDNPLDLHAFARNRLGEERYEALRLRAKAVAKP